MKDMLLIDKPKGITSFDVIRELRKKLGIQKMGHAGTLDPLASGLLIIGIDEGTKKLSEFLKLPKIYTAEVLLGAATVTDDLEGEIEEIGNTDVEEERIQEVLHTLEGVIPLQVPLYSAIKIKGKPLYKYTREGIEITPPEKEMEIRDITYISRESVSFGVEGNRIDLLKEEYRGEILTLTFDVGSGTYIRSIAREIGRRLGVPATLASLRRTSIGEYSVEEALRLDQIHGG